MLILLAGRKEVRSAVSLTSPAPAQLAGIIACAQLKLSFTFTSGMFAENVTPSKFRRCNLPKCVGNFVPVAGKLNCLVMSALSILSFRGKKKARQNSDGVKEKTQM